MVENNMAIGITFAIYLLVMLGIGVLDCMRANNLSELRPA